jgi:hypothetical protein
MSQRNQVAKKENCKGIDYFNSGEIKTKLLSWANRGTTKCTLSVNDWQQEAIFKRQ